MRFHRINIDVEFVTPCFLGGAANTRSAEWRAQSIRGQLRWWIRATAPGVLGDVSALEHRLFGSTEHRSAVTVRALDGPACKKDTPHFGTNRNAAQLFAAWGGAQPDDAGRLTITNRKTGQEFPSNAIQYLGFGPIFQGGMRPRFDPGETATVRVQVDSARLVTDDIEALGKAVSAWLMLGGIGSRSRRGFGSLRPVKVDGAFGDFTIGPMTRDTFGQELTRVIPSPAPVTGTPEWSRFSKLSRVVIGGPQPSASAALDAAGGWLVAFRRRYGIAGDARTYGGSPIANRDYEWAAPRGGAKGGGIPDKAGFGLPLPFGPDGKLLVVWKPGYNGDEQRRASPLLIRVAKFGQMAFAPVLTHLPARLIPAGQSLQFHDDRNYPKRAAPTPAQQDIVGWFLDDLVAKSKVTKVWP